MLIKDLEEEYPLVYKAALGYMNCDSESLSRGFVWSETDQGRDFWSAIDKEDFTLAKLFCPNLFARTFQNDLSHQIIKEYPTWIFKDSTFSFMIENQGDSVLKIVEQKDGYLITKL
jgi:hypothetical protein